jgi:uncharacterized damage-inducible protein DinB
MPEVWLTGPVEGVHPLLMPAAHSFLQVRAEIDELLRGLSREQIWMAPGQSASIGYHAIHLAGATERLLTYARGEELTDLQLQAARAEKDVSGLDAPAVVTCVHASMDDAVSFVRGLSPEMLTHARVVGRQRLPSTVVGLVFHAAEHATRHAGQIATLRKVVCERS